MQYQPIGLLTIVFFSALYLDISWLALALGVAGFFMVIASIEIKKPLPPKIQKQEEEEVLTPVVVQDVGDSPYLYPEHFKMKVKTKHDTSPWWWSASGAIGQAARIMFNLGKGRTQLKVSERMKEPYFKSYPDDMWK